MKISHEVMIYSALMFIFFCSFCTARTRILRKNPSHETHELNAPNVVHKQGKGKGKTKIKVIYRNPKPVNIINPHSTTLYRFGLGAADILVSGPKAANDCQEKNWMIEQLSVQKGTAQWFGQLAEPLVAMAKLMDVYALQPVCKKP